MKKHLQLGMNAGTASHRLVKDLLFKFVVEAGHTCFRCHLTLSRKDFSIEHKEPWLDSDNPIDKFFDLSNIAFSHKACNYASSRKPHQKFFTKDDRRLAMNAIHRGSWNRMGKEKQQEKRRQCYERNGC